MNKKVYKAIGAIIIKNNKILLIKRKNPPLGYACFAGHVDEGETFEKALIREVKEEGNLDITNYKQCFEGFIDGKYSTNNSGIYHWRLYQCKVKGELILDKNEAEIAEWFDLEKLKEIKLGKIWKILFTKINLLNDKNLNLKKQHQGKKL